MSIPEQVIRGAKPNVVLKKAVRGLIPDEIIDRRKQGFGVPIQEWFRGQFGVFARRELTEFCDKTDFLDRSAVMRLIESRKGSDAWLLLNFALWWKQFIERQGPSSANQVESLQAGRQFCQSNRW